MTSLNCIAASVIGLAALLGTRLGPGQRAPDVTLVGLDGEEIRYKAPAVPGAGPVAADEADGTVTVVLFVRPTQQQSVTALRDLRTWCEANPAFVPRVRSIAIASGKVGATDRESLRSLLPPRTSITGALDPDREAFAGFGVVALPTTFVIASSGTIIGVLPGRSAAFPRQLDDALRGALGIEVQAPSGETSGDPIEKRVARRTALARDLIARRRFDAAAEQLGEALRLRPDGVDLRVALGEVQLRLEDGEAASATFAEVLRRAPDDRRARIGAAKSLALGDDLRAAERALRAELLHPPLDSGLYYYLGAVLHRQSRHEDAAGAFLEAYERLLEGR